MKSLKKRIQSVEKEAHNAFKKCTTAQAVEEKRIHYLGRKGVFTDLMSQLKAAPLEQKRELGPLLNTLKKSLQEAYEKKNNSFSAQTDRDTFDVTAYLPNQTYGSLHILTHIQEELNSIFTSMGYTVADGPEVETEYYNFTTLNIEQDHPARDSHDTFWLSNPERLLRTHTSTIQARVMEKTGPPLAIFSPGRVYRNEALDASHNFLFHQAEGLFVDKNVSVSHLLATAKTFLQAFFQTDELNIRVRPGYFPFVEPGLEIDASCPFCKDGCSVCKYTTWIELLGAGLVHPNVLRYGGIDPDEFSGFAFGFGIERLAMVKYGINDIRLFQNNQLQFLTQF